MIVSQDDFDAMRLSGRSPITDTLFAAAREVIQNGGRVIVQEVFVNAPPEVRHVYSTLGELKVLEDAVARVAQRKPTDAMARPNLSGMSTTSAVQRSLKSCPDVKESDRETCLGFASKIDAYERERPGLGKSEKLNAISAIRKGIWQFRNHRKQNLQSNVILEELLEYLEHKIDSVKKEYE